MLEEEIAEIDSLIPDIDSKVSLKKYLYIKTKSQLHKNSLDRYYC